MSSSRTIQQQELVAARRAARALNRSISREAPRAAFALQTSESVRMFGPGNTSLGGSLTSIGEGSYNYNDDINNSYRSSLGGSLTSIGEGNNNLNSNSYRSAASSGIDNSNKSGRRKRGSALPSKASNTSVERHKLLLGGSVSNPSLSLRSSRPCLNDYSDRSGSFRRSGNNTLNDHSNRSISFRKSGNNEMNDHSNRSGNLRRSDHSNRSISFRKSGNNNEMNDHSGRSGSFRRNSGISGGGITNDLSERSGGSRSFKNDYSERSGKSERSEKRGSDGGNIDRKDHDGSGKRMSENSRLSNSVRSGVRLEAGQDTAQSSSDANNRVGPFRTPSKNPFGDDDDDDDDDDEIIEEWPEDNSFENNSPKSFEGSPKSQGTCGPSVGSLDNFDRPIGSVSSFGEQHQESKGGDELANMLYHAEPIKKLPTAGNGRDKHLSSSLFSTTTSETTQMHDNTVTKKNTYYNLSRAAERKQFIDIMSGNSGDGIGGNDGGSGDSGDYVDGGGNRNDNGGVSPLFEIGNDNDEMDIQTFKPRRPSVNSRVNVVENYGTEDDNDFFKSTVSHDNSGGGHDEMAGSDLPSMQELLDDERSRTEQMGGRSKKRGLLGCCDAQLGAKKSKRRKASILILLFVLVLCAAAGVMIYFIVGAKPTDDKEEGGSTESNEMGNSAPSPNLSPTSTSTPTMPLLITVAVGNTTNGTNGEGTSTNSTKDGDGNNDKINFTSAIPSSAPSASSMAQIINPTVPSSSPSPMTQIVTPTFNGGMDPPPTTQATSLKPTNTNNDMNMPPHPSLTSSAPTLDMTVSPSESASYYNVNSTSSQGSPTATAASTTSSVPSFTDAIAAGNGSFVSTPSPVFNVTGNISDFSNETTPDIPTLPYSNTTNTSSNYDDQIYPNATSSTSVSVSLDALSTPYAMSLSMKGPSTMLSRYGFSVAISGDGSLIAVGAKDAANDFGQATGAVYLYSLDTTTDSNTVLGANGTQSLSLLQVLYGVSPMDEFGNAIALSQDGNRLVVGSRSENGQIGAMRIYQLDDDMAAASVNATFASGNDTATLSPLKSWSLMEGGVISGQIPKERAGWAVSISADGNVIAMGSPKGGAEEGGSILFFKYNDISSEWDPYGSMVQGLSSEEAAGYSISLSDTGSNMVVGSPRVVNLDGTINAGKTTVYFMNGSEWQLLGQEIYGEAAGDIDGTSVAMSQDGSVLVIGGKGRSKVNATTGELILKSTGHCRVYELQASQWDFQYSIDGKSSDERLGSSVAVSPDGSIVACGGVSAVNGNSKKSGVVRLWNRVTLQESTIWPRGEDDDVEGATFGTSLAISANGEYVIVGAPTWSGADGGASAGAIQIFRM